MPWRRRIAVLDCDTDKGFDSPEIAGNFYGEIVAAWIGDEADGPEWEWVQFRVAAESSLPSSVDGFDGFIIPGSRFHHSGRCCANSAGTLSTQDYMF